jgi:two-component system, OmpR family, sensor histidine kinase MtrB
VLRIIASTLAVGAAATTLFAAAIGWWASRRLLRPLSRVADAASGIASGGLDTRLPSDPDPDLDRLASSFNEMADAVQARIQREARFSSDVSHELRSPITALTAAVEVLDARRADLPDRSQQALDVVVNQVRRFDQMVLDLLELSRLDAGVGDLHVEETVIPDLVARIARRYGFSDVPTEVGPGGDQPISIDKRRFERIIANLLDNARNHGGGPTMVAINSVREDGERFVTIAVEDAGPGVAMSERTRIFERFARGTASRSRIGTGLGLALVSEHAASHGGRAWVEDRKGGGSRFIVSLPETPR